MDFAEKMIGITLTYRGEIISNQVVMNHAEDLNGSFGLKVAMVSEELDHLAVSITIAILMDKGYGRQKLLESLSKVVRSLYDPDEFDEILEAVLSRFTKRVEIYLDIKSDTKVAESFLREVAGYPNSLVKNPGRYMSPVVAKLKKKLGASIDEEWKTLGLSPLVSA
jgi:hypothetical protein